MKIYKLLLDFIDSVASKDWFNVVLFVNIVLLVFGLMFELVSGHFLENYFGRDLLYSIAFFLVVNNIFVMIISIIFIAPVLKFVNYFTKKIICKYKKTIKERLTAFDHLLDFLGFLAFYSGLIYLLLWIFEFCYSLILGISFFSFNMFLYYAIVNLVLIVLFTTTASNEIPGDFSLSEEGVK